MTPRHISIEEAERERNAYVDQLIKRENERYRERNPQLAHMTDDELDMHRLFEDPDSIF